jgi:hypothetical protein
VFIVGVLVCGAASAVLAQISGLPNRPAPTAAHEKLASTLRETAASVRGWLAAGVFTNLEQLSTDLVHVNGAGEIQVYVIVTDVSAAHVAQLAALGLRVELILAEHGLIQGWVPADALDQIAALDFVREIRPPGYPIHNNVGAVGTQGDSILRADQARSTFGVTGAGVKVGVISDGVDHLANSVASGDLPAGVQVFKNPGGDEGTAMLEIAHDLAPGAGLGFYGPTTSADMVNGINTLAAAGARVVVDDLIFLDEPKFQDGMIAQAARTFATGGKAYVTSAGNSAQRHYRANYVRTPGSGIYPFFHNYAPPGVNIGNFFSLAAGCSVTVVLQWNNPNGASADDFDLLLADGNSNMVVAASQNVQNGTQNAYEALFYTNMTGTTEPLFIAIGEFHLVSAPPSLILDYYVFPRCGLPPLQYTVASDSVIGHEAVNEVLSVAALGALTPTVAESYSSRGPGSISFPAAESRAVPNISGIDCVNTEVGALGFFAFPFCGTSAAAPHVAGIAALVIERNPTVTSQQLHDILTGTAVDLGPVGFDFTFGFGRVDALNALTATPPPVFGVYVAAGDVNGDGKADIITGPGPGGAPHVKVFSGANPATLLASFFAYNPAFTGGVRVAAGDFNGDGKADIVTAAGPGGGPHVQVFDGVTLQVIRSFFAYSPAFTGGVFVAVGDVNGDGIPDIVTGADAGGGPHVRVFSGADLSELFSFYAYNPAFTGGVRVAVADLTGDGHADIITAAGPGGGPHVRVFSGRDLTPLASFFAYSPAFTGGVFVAAGNVLGIGAPQIVTGADAGGGPHVRVFTGSGADTGVSFFAYSSGFTGGVRVAVGNVNGVGTGEIITGAGPGGGPHVRVFTGGGGDAGVSFFAY